MGGLEEGKLEEDSKMGKWKKIGGLEEDGRIGRRWED